MRIYFTYHALKRMRDRRIEPAWIKETIESPDKTRRVGKKYYVQRRLNGKVLRAIYIKEKGLKVLTAYFIR